MATRLKETDVVIIGLGAVAECRAAFDSSRNRSRRPRSGDVAHAPRLCARRTAQQFPAVGRKGAEGESGNPHVAGHGVGADCARASIHPMQNAVGGTSLHYWAQSWRLNPWTSRWVSETKRRYGASRIPNGSTVEDWPFGLEELEPYYDKVEYEVGVSGQAGNIDGKIDPRGNHIRRAAQAGLPDAAAAAARTSWNKMPAPPKSLGWHPFPGPASVNSRPYQNRSACMYHGFCNRGGCHVDAKNSTAVTTIPRAQATGKLKVVARAHVTTIEVGSDGLAVGVNYLTDGVEYFQPAKVVLLASFTYENTRLLLLSKSKAFPNGLSNNHHQVGRHYFSHHQGAGVSALFPFNLNAWYGCRRRASPWTTGRTTTSTTAHSTSSAAANLWVYSDRRPIARPE